MKNRFNLFVNILILLMIIFSIGCNTTEERMKSKKEKPAAKVDTVVIQQMKFNPTEIIANEGDTVRWINRDIVDHNITEAASKEWSSSTLSPGKSWDMVATKNASYLCTIHPVMQGKLTVRQSR
jgi:plastocyanin